MREETSLTPEGPSGSIRCAPRSSDRALEADRPAAAARTAGNERSSRASRGVSREGGTKGKGRRQEPGRLLGAPFSPMVDRGTGLENPLGDTSKGPQGPF